MIFKHACRYVTGDAIFNKLSIEGIFGFEMGSAPLWPPRVNVEPQKNPPVLESSLSVFLVFVVLGTWLNSEIKAWCSNKCKYTGRWKVQYKYYLVQILCYNLRKQDIISFRTGSLYRYYSCLVSGRDVSNLSGLISDRVSQLFSFENASNFQALYLDTWKSNSVSNSFMVNKTSLEKRYQNWEFEANF